MPRSTHHVETLSWRVVKPNVPAPGRAPAAPQISLRFLSAALRPNSPDAPAADPAADAPLATIFQAAGCVLVEVPLAHELSGPQTAFGFSARHRA